MKAKEYLKRIRTLDRQIDIKKAELQKLELTVASLTSPQGNTEESVKSSNRSDITKVVDKIVDLQREINDEISQLMAMKTKAHRMINDLSDDRYIDLLTDYYLNNMTWQQVAEDINYSLRQVHNIHKNALISFDILYCTRLH